VILLPQPPECHHAQFLTCISSGCLSSTFLQRVPAMSPPHKCPCQSLPFCGCNFMVLLHCPQCLVSSLILLLSYPRVSVLINAIKPIFQVCIESNHCFHSSPPSLSTRQLQPRALTSSPHFTNCLACLCPLHTVLSSAARAIL
jgi:hypothetical protein